MPNIHVLRRLEGIQDILNGVHRHSDPLSPASKGQERQAFIEDFLAKVLPPIYRFGTGDATDAAGNRSGQLDVVVEYPFAPSLPAIGSGKTRLYLAESVAAVVEVKSNVASQWEEVVRTAAQLASIAPVFSDSHHYGQPFRKYSIACGWIHRLEGSCDRSTASTASTEHCRCASD
jgi:hypothetical protein